MKTLLAILFPLMLWGQAKEVDNVTRFFIESRINLAPKKEGLLKNQMVHWDKSKDSVPVYLKEKILSPCRPSYCSDSWCTADCVRDTYEVETDSIIGYEPRIRIELFVWDDGKKRVLMTKLFRDEE